MRRIVIHALPIVLIIVFAAMLSEANPIREVEVRAKARHDDGMTAGSDSSLILKDTYHKQIAALTAYFREKGYDEISALFRDPRFEIYDSIDRRFKRSAEVKSMDIEEYKRILKFEDKRDRIVGFIDTHRESLEQAEETYGISRYVISAIIGIESNFGENMGKYNPFNTYVSMYVVGYRQRFARAQLHELLTFARRNELDIFELKSSYAGAISYAQFIPYSLNKWFVGSDIFDINNNILSVANYLSYFMRRTGSIDKAVLRYNPSDLYVEAVLELAEHTRIRYSGP